MTQKRGHEMPRGICDTCGAKGDLYVYALPGIPMAVGNCRVCFDTDCYPYPVLVGNTAAIGGIKDSADWWKEAVRASLARHGKTHAEFQADVAAALADIEALSDG